MAKEYDFSGVSVAADTTVKQKPRRNEAPQQEFNFSGVSFEPPPEPRRFHTATPEERTPEREIPAPTGSAPPAPQDRGLQPPGPLTPVEGVAPPTPSFEDVQKAARQPEAAPPSQETEQPSQEEAQPSQPTKLTPVEEVAFREWYKVRAGVTGLDDNPDDEKQKYDYRGAWKAGAEPELSPQDKQYHWPSQYKADDHPNRFIRTADGLFDTKNNRLAEDLPEPSEVENPVWKELWSGISAIATQGRSGSVKPIADRVTKALDDVSASVDKEAQSGGRGAIGAKMISAAAHGIRTIGEGGADIARAVDWMLSNKEFIGPAMSNLGKASLQAMVGDYAGAISTGASDMRLEPGTTQAGFGALKMGLGAVGVAAAPIAAADPIFAPIDEKLDKIIEEDSQLFQRVKENATPEHAQLIKEAMKLAVYIAAGKVAHVSGKSAKAAREGYRGTGEPGGPSGPGAPPPGAPPTGPGARSPNAPHGRLLFEDDYLRRGGERPRVPVEGEAVPRLSTDEAIRALSEMKDAKGNPVYTPEAIVKMTEAERQHYASGGRRGLAIEGGEPPPSEAAPTGEPVKPKPKAPAGAAGKKAVNEKGETVDDIAKRVEQSGVTMKTGGWNEVGKNISLEQAREIMDTYDAMKVPSAEARAAMSKEQVNELLKAFQNRQFPKEAVDQFMKDRFGLPKGSKGGNFTRDEIIERLEWLEAGKAPKDFADYNLPETRPKVKIPPEGTRPPVKFTEKPLELNPHAHTYITSLKKHSAQRDYAERYHNYILNNVTEGGKPPGHTLLTAAKASEIRKAIDQWYKKPPTETERPPVTFTDKSEAAKYIKTIKNSGWKAFAEEYQAWIEGGRKGKRPIEGEMPLDYRKIADKLDAIEKPPKAEPPAAGERDWDLYNEQLRDNLDTFKDARGAGRHDYEMLDVADRFVEFARDDKSGKSIPELLKDFANNDDASVSQIRKLRQAATSLEGKIVPAEKAPVKPTPIDVSARTFEKSVAPSAGREGEIYKINEYPDFIVEVHQNKIELRNKNGGSTYFDNSKELVDFMAERKPEPAPNVVGAEAYIDSLLDTDQKRFAQKYRLWAQTGREGKAPFGMVRNAAQIKAKLDEFFPKKADPDPAWQGGEKPGTTRFIPSVEMVNRGTAYVKTLGVGDVKNFGQKYNDWILGGRKGLEPQPEGVATGHASGIIYELNNIYKEKPKGVDFRADLEAFLKKKGLDIKDLPKNVGTWSDKQLQQYPITQAYAEYVGKAPRKPKAQEKHIRVPLPQPPKGRAEFESYSELKTIIDSNPNKSNRADYISRIVEGEVDFPASQITSKDKFSRSEWPTGEVNTKPVQSNPKLKADFTKGRPTDGDVANALTNIPSVDPNRKAMSGVYFDQKGGVAVATDGHVLVRLSVPDITETKIVKPKTLERIDPSNPFPNYAAVIPEAHKVPSASKIPIGEIIAEADGILAKRKYFEKGYGWDGPLLKIGGGENAPYVNPELIYDALNALRHTGAKDVNVHVYTPNRAILFEDAAKPKNIALVMPINKGERGYKTILADKIKSEKPKGGGGGGKEGGPIGPRAESGPGGQYRLFSEGGKAGTEGVTNYGLGMKVSMEATTPNRVRVSEIFRVAEQELKVPIRSGHGSFVHRGGYYETGPEIIRSRDWGNIEVMTHEIAHHIDKIYWRKFSTARTGRGRNVFGPWSDELKPLDYDPVKQRAHEGFAEWMRHYLTTDEAPTHAPKFTKYMEDTWLPAHPEVQKTLKKLRGMIDTWKDQGAEGRIFNSIEFGDEKPVRRTAKDFLAETKLGFQAKWTDRLVTINHVVADILSETNRRAKMLDPNAEPITLRPGMHAGMLGRAVEKTADAKARAIVMDGTFNYALQKLGDPLKAVLQPIAGEEKKAIAYAVAKMSLERWKQGLNPGVTKADAKYFVEKHKAPHLDNFVKEITRINNTLLDYVVEAGALSKGSADLIRSSSAIYLPLKRVFFDELSGPSGGVGRGYTDLPSPVYRFKGSGREIVNPLDAMVAQWARMIGIADKARVTHALVSMAKLPGASKWIREIEPPKEAKTYSVGKLRDMLGAHGLDIKRKKLSGLVTQAEIDRSLTPVDYDELVTLFNAAKEYYGKENIVAHTTNGKTRFYEIHTALYHSIKGLDRHHLPWAVQMFMGAPARSLRLGATGIRPGFSYISNPARDVPTFVMQSETAKRVLPGSSPMKQLTEGIKGELALPFRAIGGMVESAIGGNVREMSRFAGGEMSQPLGLDRDMIRTVVMEAMAGDIRPTGVSLKQEPGKYAKGFVKGLKRHLKVTYKHPIEVARKMMSVTEAGPRIAEGKGVRDKYEPLIESALARGDAAEAARLRTDFATEFAVRYSEATTNFRQQGEYAAILNQIVPFFTPKITSLSIFSRKLKNSPWRTLARGAAGITAPSLALWWLNKDEDWYKNLPTTEKYGFWHFPVGDGEIARIPKPFEWGYAFGGIPEGAWNSLYESDPDHVKAVVGNAFRQSSPVNIDNPAYTVLDVTAWGPILEASLDWDAYRGKPLTPPGLEGLLPQERYLPYTTETSKEISKILNSAGVRVSPIDLDHLASGYTGGLALELLKGLPGEIKESADYPVIGRLFTRPDAYGLGSQPVTDLYNLHKEAGEYKRTIDKGLDPDPENPPSEERVMAAAELLGLDSDAVALYNAYGTLEAGRAQIQAWREQSRLIDQMDLDPDMKAKLKLAIGQAAAALASGLKKTVKASRKAAKEGLEKP